MEAQSTSPPTSPAQPPPSQQQQQQQQQQPPSPQPQDHKHAPQSISTSTRTTRSIHRIKSHPALSPFRRRIYLVLLSIPPGRWTTYAALARYMATTTTTTTSSSPLSSSNSPPSSTTTTTTNKPNPNPPGTKPRAKPKGAIGSARAVGTAMRTNPFAPDVPCHRVLASDGTLGGYMGDGPSTGGRNLQKKREMLEAEGVRFLGEGLEGKKGKGKGVRAVGECWVDFVG
ncbi:methylated-DNA--protein-cysteine methyltransferase [Aspergillus melleus]|uniref:Methylated-DNA--protein-cysteine methyltransferase n=1 Tax=Aspergillus melleus TaxID=138277 RepID=A0ACC3BA54_9EURO|nr:methylated-DNA--protein-cysteine methyltransferase [Aspergillus melleus]